MDDPIKGEVSNFLSKIIFLNILLADWSHHVSSLSEAGRKCFDWFVGVYSSGKLDAVCHIQGHLEELQASSGKAGDRLLLYLYLELYVSNSIIF